MEQPWVPLVPPSILRPLGSPLKKSYLGIIRLQTTFIEGETGGGGVQGGVVGEPMKA